MHPATHSSPLPPLPLPRGGAVGHILGGTLHVIGGGLSGKEHVARHDACDLATGRWRELAPMPTPRSNVASAVLDGRIVVLGGLVGAATEEGRPSTVVEAYDPVADAWTTLAPLPCPRVRAGVVAVGGRIIAIGGRRDELDTPVIAAYDPRADRWSELGTTPFPARHLAATVLDGRILVSGGFTATPGGAQKGLFLDAFYEVDAATGACTMLAPLPQARTAHALVAADGRVHALGGVDKDKQLITTIDSYDPRTGAWNRAGNLASGRAMAVAAAHGGVIHLLGGWTRLFKEANPSSDAVTV